MTRMPVTQIKPAKEILAENLDRILKECGRGAARRVSDSAGWQETRLSLLRKAKAGNPDLATIDRIIVALWESEGVEVTAGQLLEEIY